MNSRELQECVRSGDIYVYKLTSDNGGAPCIHKDKLSLAICKPKIRTSAQTGDWILGFGGKSVAELKNKLIYIARVSSVIKDGEYYRDERYADRPDCIYEERAGRFAYRHGKKFHSEEDIAHDIGEAPEYDRAVTLLSDTFVYLGGEADESSIAAVRDIYESLPRDYRKNHDPQVRERLESYIVAMLLAGDGGSSAQPTHQDTKRKCGGEEDELLIVSTCSR
ncbi:hypothetical protein GCM10028862_03190 [Luteimonas pelagia]